VSIGTPPLGSGIGWSIAEQDTLAVENPEITGLNSAFSRGRPEIGVHL
jgi:hypothetical protein